MKIGNENSLLPLPCEFVAAGISCLPLHARLQYCSIALSFGLEISGKAKYVDINRLQAQDDTTCLVPASIDIYKANNTRFYVIELSAVLI